MDIEALLPLMASRSCTKPTRVASGNPISKENLLCSTGLVGAMVAGLNDMSSVDSPDWSDGGFRCECTLLRAGNILVSTLSVLLSSCISWIDPVRVSSHLTPHCIDGF